MYRTFMRSYLGRVRPLGSLATKPHNPEKLHRPCVSIYTVPRGGQTFSTSPHLLKKKDRGSNGATKPDVKHTPDSLPDDPFDLSQLHHGITTAVSRLKDDLSKLRAGGRFNIDTIENLRVHLNKGSKEFVKLGELAQVIPKGGRMVTILASVEDHLKPISSAVVSSNLSLTPQADAHNSLQLNIPIPPPTKESRDQTIAIAKSAMERAVGAVRDSRGVLHKRLQDMQKRKSARPDDVKKAQVQMEKLTEKGQKEVKDLFEGARKALERV